MNIDSLRTKYGKIAGNRSINESINRCFQYICEDDVFRFIAKFQEQPHTGDQVMHTYRELLLGAYLCSTGFIARYEQQVDGKMPDWIILRNSSSLACIIELVNFHIDREIEDQIKKAGECGKAWVGWMPSNNKRLYQRLEEKADAYEKIVLKHNVSYVVAVFGDFFADLDREEVHQCVFKDYGGLFKTHETLTGVLLFLEAGGGKYVFEYIGNPQAKEKFDLTSGSF